MQAGLFDQSQRRGAGEIIVFTEVMAMLRLVHVIHSAAPKRSWKHKWKPISEYPSWATCAC